MLQARIVTDVAGRPTDGFAWVRISDIRGDRLVRLLLSDPHSPPANFWPSSRVNDCGDSMLGLNIYRFRAMQLNMSYAAATCCRAILDTTYRQRVAEAASAVVSSLPDTEILTRFRAAVEEFRKAATA